MALKDFMARSQGPDVVVPEPPSVVTPGPSSRVAAPSPLHTTYLGAGTTIKGELRCGESLRIDGKLVGEVHCEQLLTIGEKGSLEASIDGETVVVAGEVKGDIKASRKITLEATARVTGNLTTPGIVIQEGARLEGRIMIGGGPAPEVAPPPAAKPRAPEKAPGVPPEVPSRASVIASGA